MSRENTGNVSAALAAMAADRRAGIAVWPPAEHIDLAPDSGTGLVHADAPDPPRRSRVSFLVPGAPDKTFGQRVRQSPLLTAAAIAGGVLLLGGLGAALWLKRGALGFGTQ